MNLRKREKSVKRVKKLSKQEKVHTAMGSAIRGEKIIAQARKIIDKGVTKGSSGHRIQRVDLENNAYCIIAKPLRYLKVPIL